MTEYNFDMANSSESSHLSTIAASTGLAMANNITQLVEHPGIFLQSGSAKVISGAFAWLALCLTCHQVHSTFQLIQ